MSHQLQPSASAVTLAASSQHPPSSIPQRLLDSQGPPPSTLSHSTSRTTLGTHATARGTHSHSTSDKGHDESMFASAGHHPSSTNPLFILGPWFKDKTGRVVTLRGVNLSGGSKMPANAPSHRSDNFLEDDGRSFSFIGRPFPLEDADEHLSRLKHWGFNFLRFIVTWESIEHAGPGIYDYDFFEYLVQVLRKCKEYGFKCFLDPHQDVWSRFSGGSGAPLWTLYLAGLDPEGFPATNAALVHNQYPEPEAFPKMVWATNYNKLAAATMFTLFFAGSTFAPKCVVDQMNIQDYLQSHYIKSYMALAEYIHRQHGIEDDVVVGYDTLNEPSAGWIGVEDVTKIPHHQELKNDATPTPFQAMMLGQGITQTVEHWHMTFFGPKKKGMITVKPEGRTAWLSPEKRASKDAVFGWRRADEFPKAGECIWGSHGVWDIVSQEVLNPTYFLNDPETGEPYLFDTRSFLPFCRRFAQAVRSIHRAAIIFLEPPVNEIPPSLPPPHDDEDVAQFDLTSRVVYAPHWYDGLTLLGKKWNFFNIDYLGVKRGRYPNYASAVKIGDKAIRECFRHQLACIKEEGQQSIGMHPTLIGEIGIPYDMYEGRSYKPGGNYKDQVRAMDANMYALESNHLNFTLWNYCADNSHKWGDRWNGEDLSLWSKNDIPASILARPRASRLQHPERITVVPHRIPDMVQSWKDKDKDESDLSTTETGDSPSSGLSRRSSPGATVVGSDDEMSEAIKHTRLDIVNSTTSNTSTTLSSKPLMKKRGSDDGVSSTSSTNTSKDTRHWGSELDEFDLGGRAVIAFCRPYAQKVAGLPMDLSFSIANPVFRFSFRTFSGSDKVPVSATVSNPTLPLKAPRRSDPTEIYLPRIHFPNVIEYCRQHGEEGGASGVYHQVQASSSASTSSRRSAKEPVCPIQVSCGVWEFNEETQMLYWWVDNETDEHGEQRDALHEITVHGRKWTGKSSVGYRASGGLWDAFSHLPPATSLTPSAFRVLPSMSDNKKRPGEPGSGKDRKRAKMQTARSIETQSASSSPRQLYTGQAGSARAPRTVDVVNFAEARAFEINALHSAMTRSQDSASQRAFQSLPRNLRRRAASHNIKRLPVRLRERAKREVEAEPVKKGKKPDNRYKKRRHGTLKEEYMRRQGTKRWLETHIWQAKRMKMVDIWGYKLADHSNENGIKAAYRSSHHQCILQDMSYYGCMEIKGSRKAIASVFERMMDPTVPKVTSARYVTGKRQYMANLYELDAFPQKMIAPMTLLWRQASPSAMATDSGDDEDAQLWVWIHPSSFDLALKHLREAAVQLDLGNKVSIEDLENSLVMFEFTGPRSTALLQAVLRLSALSEDSPYTEAHRVWEKISTLRSSTVLPPGIVLGLLVDDPRLTFPQKAQPRKREMDHQVVHDVEHLLAQWPDSVAWSALWDPTLRSSLLTNMATEGALNTRRQANLVPGTKLPTLVTDAQIPVLLFQREGKPSLGPAPGTLASTAGASREYDCGWTLVLPKGWGMAFWKSLIFAGAKPGGMRERHSFHFETRQSCFPYDYPSTSAYEAYALREGAERQAAYERTPVAKRVNYRKLGVEEPFVADWAKCLASQARQVERGGGSGAQVEGAEVCDKDVWLLQTAALVDGLRGLARQPRKDVPEATPLTLEALNAAVVGDALQAILAKRHAGGGVQPPLPLPQLCRTVPRIEHAVVRVAIDFLNRGTSSMNGRIFAIPEDKYEAWCDKVRLRGKRDVEGQARRLQKSMANKVKVRSWVDEDDEMDKEDEGDEDEDDLDELDRQRPPAETLLGYITTGQYCYSEGKSFAIGCCSAVGLARLMRAEQMREAAKRQQDQPPEDTTGTHSAIKATNGVPRMMVLIRGTTSHLSRPAKLTILT
ncbi:hypothetical protein BGZ73_006883 [Actinomortierella ambigua]|nr:hypothetical protein BGZ73_006883 [Actinomortierella ambigua]